MKLKLSLFIFASLLPNLAFADCSNNGCTGLSTALIDKIYLTGHSDGRVFIELNGNTSILDCQLAAKVRP